MTTTKIFRSQLLQTGLALGIAAAFAPSPASAQSNCEPYNSTYCLNLRNAELYYQQQRRAEQLRQQQRINQQHDWENGVSQRSGVTGGVTPDGQGGWIGYQGTTQ